MKRTLPVLYLATDRRGWCQFLRAVPLVGGGRAEAALPTDWQGTVVAADIALLLLKLRQAGQEERRVTRAGVSLMSERGGAKSGRSLQKSAVAAVLLLSLSLSLSFFLRHIYALHAWDDNDMSDLGRQPRYSMGRFCKSCSVATQEYSLADSRAQTRHAPHRA